MAKGSMLMGTQRGKLGESVLYRAGGSQRQRAYISVVGNPRTDSQMKQRVKLANVVAMYRVLQNFCKDSFTNKLQRQSGYNAFVKANLAASNVFLSKDQAEVGASVAFPYVIGSGTLQPIIVTGTGVNAVTDIYVGDLAITDTTTVGAVSSAILANNQNFQAGDEITYISILQVNNPNTGVPQCSFSYYSFVLNTASTAVFRESMPAVASTVRNGAIGHGDSVGSGAFAWVFSRKRADGSLNCSRQSLIVTSEDVYSGYTSDAALQAALASYNTQSNIIITPDGQGSTAANSGNAGDVTPSVSSVRVGGTSVTSSTSQFTLSTGQAVNISGSNLVPSNIVLYVNGNSVDGIEFTGGANSVSGSIPASLNGTKATRIGVYSGGASLFSVTLKVDDDDDARI